MPENLYKRAYEALRGQIERGEYHPGDRLPAENELAASMGISRATLRHALDRLEGDGLINRIRGSGSYVTQPKLLHGSTSFIAGYRREAEQIGRSLRTEVLELGVQPAGKLGERLSLPANARVTRLVRRRWIEGFNDGRPVVYTTVYVPYAIFPDMCGQDFTDASLYDMLESRALKVCHASRVLEVRVPGDDIAAALQLGPFEPAIYVDSVGLDARGRRVEYAQSYYPAGSSRFLIEIDR